MGKAKQVQILNHIFTKQKDAEVFVRNLLLKLEPIGFVDSNSEHWLFFYELLSRHPEYNEKKGSGIELFLIGRSTENHIELNLKRIDKSFSDVSWRKCITGNSTSILANLKAAMRVAIQPQIDRFRDLTYDKLFICEICSLPLGDIESDIDHTIHFDTLVRNFLSLYPDHPKDFDDGPLHNKAMFKDIDSAYSNRWYEFHDQNAILRIVHGSGNTSRPKAKIIFGLYEDRLLP
jgi:hypothetical protein